MKEMEELMVLVLDILELVRIKRNLLENPTDDWDEDTRKKLDLIEAFDEKIGKVLELIG